MVGGYDVKVTEKYQDAFNCVICLRIIKKATNGCDYHVFCCSCLNKYLIVQRMQSSIAMCPGGCRKEINVLSIIPNLTIDLMINKLKCKCSNEDCTWTGDLLDLVEVHQKFCLYKLIKCERQKCHETFLKQEKEKHEDVCLYKTLKCIYCRVNQLRKYKGDHEIFCAAEKIECNFHEVGCQTLICRKDVDKHEHENQSLHLRLSFQAVQRNEKRLTKENNDLKQAVSELDETADKLIGEVLVLKQENTDLKLEVNEFKENATNEICVVKQNAKEKKTLEIELLKEKLGGQAIDVLEIQDDNSLIIKLSIFNLNNTLKVPHYYTKDQQKLLLEKLQTQNKSINRNLLFELLNAIPYHWHKNIKYFNYDKSFLLLFPISGNQIEDFCFQYKNRCKVQCNKNEIEVNIVDSFRRQTINIIIGGNEIEVEPAQRVNPFQAMELVNGENVCAGGIRIFYDLLLVANAKFYKKRKLKGEKVQKENPIKKIFKPSKFFYNYEG